ncbi:MAG TPA: molybdopterin-binding protein, partial [Lacipirellulaceae bacterium]|nr:molybdopterin-binding protein [Lacipirellulaceae bacterium]
MSQSTTQHRCESPKTVRCAVVTVSDTRTIDTDRGGKLVADLLNAGGHRVTGREIVRDDPREIEPLVRRLADPSAIDAILITG